MAQACELPTTITGEDEYKVGQSHQVHITHIESPHLFYIRLIKYDEIMPMLEKPSIPVDTLKNDMNIVYYSKSCSKNVRGNVTSIYTVGGKEMCNAYACDYGFCDLNIPKQSIMMPSYQDMVLPLAVPCELYLCAPTANTGFSPEAIAAMKYYVGNEVALMTVKYKNAGKLVVLLKNSCPDDIATILALTEFTSLAISRPSVSKLKSSTLPVNSFTFKEHKVGEVYRVRVQSGTSLSAFFVAPVDEFKKYRSSQQKQLTNHCRSEVATNIFSVGDSVAVQYQGPLRYERAVVKKIVEPFSKALVQLLEWGNEDVVRFTNMKLITKEHYTQQPAIAIFCSAEEEQAWDNRLQKFLYPGYEFEIKIIKAGHKFEKPNQVELIKID